MADSKISALPASTVPLAGTEVLPIVQSSTTKQVSVANLTAGRAISATAITASTGNFIVGTSGQGVDFSVTPGTGTSELFADYEEGTWTATLTASVTAPTIPVTTTGTYTIIGRSVTVTCSFLAVSLAGSVGDVRITGLPYTVGSQDCQGICGNNNLSASSLMCTAASGAVRLDIRSLDTTIYTPTVVGTVYVLITITYFV